MSKLSTAAVLIVILSGCSDRAEPPESVVGQLIEAARTYVIEDVVLSEETNEPLSPGTLSFLNSMNDTLDDVHDAESAAAAKPGLQILADRMNQLPQTRVRPETLPEASVEAGESVLAGLDAWNRFLENMRRLENRPEAAAELREPFEELVSFFRSRNRDG